MSMSRPASLSGGGTIYGDITITGDLKVEGGGSFTYDEIIEGNLEIDTDIYLGQYIIHKGDTDSKFGFAANNRLYGYIGGADVFDIYANEIWFNPQNADIDFQIGASGASKDAFVVEGSSGNIGIGTDSPGSLLDLSHSAGITSKSINLTRTLTGNTSATNRAILFDINKTSTMDSGATLTYDGMHIDLDDAGADNAASTVNLTGLKVDVNSDDATGTTKNVGLNVSVGGADTNYAALFSGGSVGIGTSTPTSGVDLHIKDTTDAILKIESTQAGTDMGGIQIYHNTGSPADGDSLGYIQFNGNDSGASTHNYVNISAYSDDVTGGTEDGRLQFQVIENASAVTMFKLSAGSRISLSNNDNGTSYNIWKKCRAIIRCW